MTVLDREWAPAQDGVRGARAVAAPMLAHLPTLMSAHARAAVGNLGIMEIDPHMVRRSDDMVTYEPETKHGHLILLWRPGRRTDCSEATFPAHPPGKR
jgi:hypothetical protein